MPRKYSGITLREWNEGIRKKKIPLTRKILVALIIVAIVPVGIGIGFVLHKLGL